MTHRALKVILGLAVLITGAATGIAPWSPPAAYAKEPAKIGECSAWRQNTGKVAGAVLGWALGNEVAKKTNNKAAKAAISVAGAAGGLWLGGKVACALGEADRKSLEVSTDQTVRSGKATSWTNPETGVSGTASVSDTKTENVAFEVPIHKERITKVPPLELIVENYQATSNLNIRQDPNDKAAIVGKLNKGDVVSVTGQVQGQPWYLIAQNGVAVGFVHKDRMTLAAQSVATATEASLEKVVETRTVQAERTCRTVTQTVIVKGQETSEDVTACQGPNGWEIT